MSDDAEFEARKGAMLRELAELSMALSRDAAAAALAAPDPAEKARAIAGFHRAARGVRQCLALEARLAREARREAREVAAEANTARLMRTEERKTRVSAAVERVINEAAADDEAATRLEARLEERLDAWAEAPEFLDLSVETLIGRLCADLGLRAPSVPRPDHPGEGRDPGSVADREPPAGDGVRAPPAPGAANGDVEFDAAPPNSS